MSVTPFTLSFKNEHIIYENEIKCSINDSEFNLSYNPTLTDSTGSLANFTTTSSFAPYATAIGLYNDAGDLLMVAKFAKPIMISPHTNTNFIIKYDL